MRQPKKTVALSSLGKQHTKNNLIRFYPFLRKEFRVLKESEIKDEKVFAELFPNEKIVNLEWLRATYMFQQCDTKTQETSVTEAGQSSPKE